MLEELHVRLERVLEAGVLDLGLRSLGLEDSHRLAQLFLGELGTVHQLVDLVGVRQGLQAGHDLVAVLDLAFLLSCHQ